MRSAWASLPTRRRLALLGAGGVLLAMIASLVAFNLFEGWQVEREARASLDEAMGWEPESGVGATRMVSFVLLDTDATLNTEDMGWYTDLDLEVAAWCARHLETDVVQRATLDDAVCFVEIGSLSWGGLFDEGEGGWYAAYVDTTSHSQLVGAVNLVLVLIALVGSTAAGVAGWMSGRRIERADATQKRFFENMSHELKTPLAAIQGYAEGMVAGTFAPTYAAGSIVRESERMRTIVDEIMSLSRLEAGAVALRREDVDVFDLVQDCLMPFEGIVRQRGISVELEVAAGSVYADADLLSHALENVLANAFRHAATRVRVTFDGRLLSVENDGEMPDERDVEHLFDRFHTSAAERGGTGIGLALTQEIVALHKWDILAERAGDMLRITIETS